MSDPRIPLLLQWHITTDCSNRCKHCYMFDSRTFEHERRNTLPFSGLLAILDDLERFEDKYGASFPHVALTGGDPLLRKDWPDLVRQLRMRGRDVSILGNPETLSEDVLSTLADLGVAHFQLSLDGLESVHDQKRSPGSFQRTTAGIRLLRNHGITCNIMFTLYPDNADQLLPVMRFVAEETEATSFCFDIGCFVGNGEKLDRDFSAVDLRGLFDSYLAEKGKFLDKGISTRFLEKSRLLRLSRFASGTFYPITSPNAPVSGGCWAGWGAASILSDGTVLPCRRLPVKIGKMPEQSFEEIFLGSEVMKKLRRPESYAACGICDFYAHCRGCVSLVYSLTGDIFGRNPLCFRDGVDRQTEEVQRIPKGVHIGTSLAEEWAIVKSRYAPYLRESFCDYLDDAEFRQTYLTLSHDVGERMAFLRSPRLYLVSKGTSLDDDKVIVLMLRVTSDHFNTPGTEKEKVESLRDPIAAYALCRMLNDMF